MKKGVVLLLTLFFITSLSVLVLKNLDDTDEFLEKENFIMNNTQVLVSLKNTQKEISKILQNNEDSFVNDVLGDETFKSSIALENDLNIDFSLKKYDRTNVNEINVKDSKLVQNLFDRNDVFEYEQFVEIYKNKISKYSKEIETSKQMKDIVTLFIRRTNNDNILNIEDQLGFAKDENSDFYELNVDVKFNNTIASAYYILRKKEGEVEYFDISFK